MRPKITTESEEKLIVRLHDTDEKWSFQRIADHLKKPKKTIRDAYDRQKKPKFHKPDGRKRITSDR